MKYSNNDLTALKVVFEVSILLPKLVEWGMIGIFRNQKASRIGCFSKPLGITTSYQAGICGALRAIESRSSSSTGKCRNCKAGRYDSGSNLGPHSCV
ncbi:hypothetical protein MTR_0352s0020 [Medicago truncatula]|uniref:Uncharacterized protein n=1 Tax=Medicago truncatula TaxID=3880 RepID=A0A072TR62_MEDTR|nr:hypothetical protein MTR_0352s0020 [Medicago truncatula]